MSTKARLKAQYGIDNASNTITNVADPVNAQDVATKNFVATQVATVTGGMVYQGTWNASTNTPALVSSTGTKGFFYKVSVAGTTTLDGLNSWNVGDIAAFDGTVWDKIDGIASEVLSVAGRTGAVVLAQADISGLTTGSSPTFAAVTATTFTGALAGNASTATTAGNVTGTVAIANGGTGATSASAALTALGAYPATNPNSYIAASGAPVQTVAGRTGTVTLAQADIAGLTTSSSPTFAGLTAPTINMAQASLSTATLTTSTTAANQVLDTFATASFRSVEYLLQMTSGTAYAVAKLIIAHDGTNTFLTQYGEVDTGAALATFDASIATGTLSLTTTPVNAATTYKVVRTTINV